jgi:energy-coupling factor transporter ATP-binding protein EcfA2
MDGRRRLRRRSLVVSAIAVVWSGALLTIVAFLYKQGAEKAAAWAGVLGSVTAVAAFTEPLVERAIARSTVKKTDGSEVAGLHRAAEQLADVVRSQWRDEARMRRLQDPWPLPLRWTAAEEDLADHADVVFRNRPQGNAPTATGPETLPGQLAGAVDLYERLPGKRLVVLGPPGSGKSTMAMTLALALLDRWQPGMQVPVLFPLASWDPSRTRLDDWLAEYLSENYQLSGDSRDSRVIGRKLLAGNMLLPILDGLDEIPEALRPLGIKNLNRELDAAQPIILTCRTPEYREAVETGDVLTLAAVVELQPLHPATIIRYLTETTPAGPRARRWAPVFESLRNDPDGALATVLRTPLMVFLTRAIYGDNPRDPSELLGQQFQDPPSIENHLLTQLIPATYHDRPHSAEESEFHWQTDDVTSWLTYLARHAAGPGRSDLAWWQLERAVPPVVIDGVGGLLGGLVVGFVFGPVVGIVFAVAVVLAATAPRSRPWTVEARLRDRLDSWTNRLVARGAKGEVVAALLGLGEKVPLERRVGLAVGRFAAIAAGFIDVLIVYRHASLFHAVADGLAVGLAVGLAAGFFTISLRTTPSEVQFVARKGIPIFLRHLAIGLASGVGVGVVAGVLLGSGFGLLTAVVIGLTLGLMDGLNVWLDVSTDVTCGLSPQSTRRAERIAALGRSIADGVAIAAASGVAFGLAYGTGSAITHALVFGVGFGLADRYMGLSASVWGRYFVAKAWLALSGRLPWRLMAFLDDAYTRGLLRRVGAGYQFRHARLQEYLASARG